jgi:hypothetical protein
LAQRFVDRVCAITIFATQLERVCEIVACSSPLLFQRARFHIVKARRADDAAAQFQDVIDAIDRSTQLVPRFSFSQRSDSNLVSDLAFAVRVHKDSARALAASKDAKQHEIEESYLHNHAFFIRKFGNCAVADS